ncbi:MAG: Flagellar transcriptional regulator FtcR [Beijerinckiaceae bacterium]|nr:MAG: Flagellar transcriptional regulator FtcR [Beijerinckiaceae bacterium]
MPRRERRILEYLVNNRGRRVSKAQIFNSIYGIFDDRLAWPAEPGQPCRLHVARIKDIAGRRTWPPAGCLHTFGT